MIVWYSLVLSTALSADPVPQAATSKAAKPKVYVVYVTVVEVDADGNETVLFTPKVQTTGNPAGVTVEYVDGRSFEFNCQMLNAPDVPALVRLPGKTATASAQHVARSMPRKIKIPVTTPAALAPAAPDLLVADALNPVKSAPTANETSARKPDEFYLRTYEVSDLIDAKDVVKESDFAPLIQTLKTVAHPESWTGKATIRPFTSTQALVIQQNDAGHKAVAEALKQLRPRTIQATEKVE